MISDEGRGKNEGLAIGRTEITNGKLRVSNQAAQTPGDRRFKISDSKRQEAGGRKMKCEGRGEV